MLSDVRGHLVIASKSSEPGRMSTYLTPGHALHLFKLTFMDHLLSVRHCDVHFSFISYLIFRMSQWAALLFSCALYWWEIGAERGEETFPSSARLLLLLLYLAVGFLWPAVFGSSGRLAYSETPLPHAVGRWVTLSQLSSQVRAGSVLGEHL